VVSKGQFQPDSLAQRKRISYEKVVPIIGPVDRDYIIKRG